MNKENLISDLKDLKSEYERKAAIFCNMERTEEGLSGNNEVLNMEKSKEYEDKIKTLKEENQNYIIDIDFFKDVVRRLNEQLNRYCESQGPLPEYIGNKKKETLDLRSDHHKLNSLLYAYDEVINEQSETLGNMKKQYESAMKKIRILQSENEDAFKYIEMMESEPCEDGQLKMVVADARVLMEERELLLKEISLQRQRKCQLELEYEKKVQKLECLLNGTESKVNAFKLDFEKQKEELLSLQKENSFLKNELKNCVKEEEHKKAVFQCSRLLEKLKKVHRNETLDMKNRVQQIKSEQEQLVEKLSTSSEQFKVIKKAAFGYKTNLRKHNSKLGQQAEVIKILRRHRKTLEIKITGLTHILSQLIHDRKSLLLTLQYYKKELEKYAMVVKLRCNEIGKLTLKMKDDSFRWSQKFAEAEGRRQAAEEAWHHSMEDATRLRKLLQQKDEDLKRYLSNFSKKI